MLVNALTNKTIGEELVDRGESQAGDGSCGVFRSDNFKEGPEEKVGFHFCQVWRRRQRQHSSQLQRSAGAHGSHTLLTPQGWAETHTCGNTRLHFITMMCNVS